MTKGKEQLAAEQAEFWNGPGGKMWLAAYARIERGILGTTPLDHPAGAPIFKFPETASPSINQQSCGQTAKPVAPSRPPATVEAFTGQTDRVETT